MIGEKLKEEKKEVLELPERGSGDSKFASGSTIYQHLRSLEMEVYKKVVHNNNEKVQIGASDSSSSSPPCREIVVDWLVVVTERCRLLSDTLHLTISHFDRYLSLHAVDRNKLQLLGVSCMLIAAKYEEICPPRVEDFCSITSNTYCKQEILDMEREVRKSLSCEGVPTIKSFLRIFTRVALENWKEAPSLRFGFLGSYLAELSLLDCRCVQFLPSIVAASVIFLSRFTIQPEKNPWCLALQNYFGYRPSDLMECIIALHELQLNIKGSSFQATRTRYMNHESKYVPLLTPPSEIPAHYFEDIDKQAEDSSQKL